MNSAESLHDRLWARFQRAKQRQSVPNVPCAYETERPLESSSLPNPPARVPTSRAQGTTGTVALLPDGMCEHIEEKARWHPANVGRVVRCAACFLAAHPDWRPRPYRFVGSIAELRAECRGRAHSSSARLGTSPNTEADP